MGNDNRDTSQRMYEKAAQNYFKESWELLWSVLGVVTALLLVFAGIYFSEIALAKIFGEQGFSLYFDWGCSIIISCLEVAAIKLLGNKLRSADIKEGNFLEHNIARIGTYILFAFDIATNWYGLVVTSLLIGTKMTIIPIIFIGFFGTLMATSEIYVGWMIRAVAVSYAGWSYARTKYTACKEYLEKEALKTAHSDIPNNNNRQQGMGKDFDRFVEDSGQEYRPNLQPALQRSQYRGNNGRNQPRG
jgi:hypothetical protein